MTPSYRNDFTTDLIPRWFQVIEQLTIASRQKHMSIGRSYHAFIHSPFLSWREVVHSAKKASKVGTDQCNKYKGLSRWS